MVAWIITDLFGGMMFWAMAVSFVVLPVLLVYVISLIDTLLAVIRDGSQCSRVKVWAHLAVLVVALAFQLYQSEF